MITPLLVFGLLLLQPVWYLWLAPPNVVPPWLAAIVMVLPILPAALLWLARRPSAGFWGGTAALFYFTHGVTEAWASPEVRTLALIETALATALIFAASWKGLKARAAKRAAARARGPEPPAAE